MFEWLCGPLVSAEIESLKETNRRLNRRLQKYEAMHAGYRRQARYHKLMAERLQREIYLLGLDNGTSSVKYKATAKEVEALHTTIDNLEEEIRELKKKLNECTQ